MHDGLVAHKGQTFQLGAILSQPGAFVSSFRERLEKVSGGRAPPNRRDAPEVHREGIESAFRTGDTICKGGGEFGDQLAGPKAAFGQGLAIEGGWPPCRLGTAGQSLWQAFSSNQATLVETRSALSCTLASSSTWNPYKHHGLMFELSSLKPLHNSLFRSGRQGSV